MDESQTTFESKCKILGDAWLKFRSDPEWHEYISYNDLALPIAFALGAGIVAPSPLATGLVEDAWDGLLNIFSGGVTWVDEDGNELPPDWAEEDFQSLDEVIEFFESNA